MKIMEAQIGRGRLAANCSCRISWLMDRLTSLIFSYFSYENISGAPLIFPYFSPLIKS